MAVQRKVFRIEEYARSRAPESQAPREPLERDALERARAQIAEAQACQRELRLIHAAIAGSRNEMAALDASARDGEPMSRASRELQAIVAGTERATQNILRAAEDIDQAAATLAAALQSGYGHGLALDIRDRVLQIFETCNFQDITGQRVGNVAATLQSVEQHAARLLELWQRIERFEPVVVGDDSSDRRFLNGPKLPGDRGHSTQDDIDGMFGRA